MHLQYMTFLEEATQPPSPASPGASQGGTGAATAATAPPGYIFSSVDGGSPLLDDFAIPEFLDPSRTAIEVQNAQFYLGPTRSGAPFHFHRAAFNMLVYGRKKWILQPPEHSSYVN
jgi:hypothetical protein